MRRPPFVAVAIAVVAVIAAVAVWRIATAGDKGDAKASPKPRFTIPGESIEPQPSPIPSPVPAGPVAGPINPDYPGLTTLRGNWHRDFFGIGPVPQKPKVQWRVGPWCGSSEDNGVTKQWCGTGWNGQPNVIPQEGGAPEVRIGGYDYDYHFLDGYTGKNTHPPFSTDDLAKGSATSDPDGCELYYAGSRDNKFRIIGLDQRKPRELWSMDADSSVPDPRWNDDWDGSAQIVGDYMLVGGENSWFYVVKLNKKCSESKVSVDPKIVFSTPGWDAELLKDVPSGDISIEGSIAYDDKTETAYFGSSGGLIQGWNLSKIFNGGSQATRTFRFWTGGENDASVVIDDEGFLYVENHYEPPNSQAQRVGQLLKLDPRKKGNPVVWSIKENTSFGGEAGFFSTPALVGDTLFASATGGDLMAINAKTGKVYWRERLEPPLWSGPAVVDGTLVIGDCSGTLYGFDVSNVKKSPKKLWDLNLGGCIESTPAIWNGWIYVGTRSGYEYGLADRSWKKEQGDPAAPAPVSPSSASASPST